MNALRNLANAQKGDYVYQDYDLVAMVESMGLQLRRMELKKYSGGYFVLEVQTMDPADGAVNTVKFWSRDEPTPEDEALLTKTVHSATVRYGEYTDEKGTRSGWKWVDINGATLSGGKREYEEGE